MNDYTTIFLAILAFGLIAGTVVAISETRLYPIALGVVGLSLLYFLLSHPKASTIIGNLYKGAADKIGP